MGALLGVCVTLASAACADGPTELDRAGIEAAPVQSAAKAGGGGTMEVVCSISYAAYEGPHAYLYDRITVKLPAASRAADGSLRQYRFRNYAGTKVVGAANCTIPATELAAAHMDRFFGVKERGGRRMPQTEGGASLMSDEHTLPTLEVKACQHGGTYPLCDPEPIDWDGLHNPPEQQVCHTDCGGGGGDSGGSTSEPPAEEEPKPEPCKTADPVIDTPKVQEGMDLLWKGSNADAQLTSRRETGGWIVRTSTGYRIEPWPVTLSFCGGDFTVPYPAEGPGAVVGFIHTHPYAVNETIIACDANGQTSVETYTGGPSDIDRDTSVALGQSLGRAGPLPGIILDKQGIREFSGWNTASDENHARCGF